MLFILLKDRDGSTAFCGAIKILFRRERKIQKRGHHHSRVSRGKISEAGKRGVRPPDGGEKARDVYRGSEKKGGSGARAAQTQKFSLKICAHVQMLRRIRGERRFRDAAFCMRKPPDGREVFAYKKGKNRSGFSLTFQKTRGSVTRYVPFRQRLRA